MWHQQRKEEKRIKGLMVDKRRRAERRRDYYEKIKMDPNQFLQARFRAFLEKLNILETVWRRRKKKYRDRTVPAFSINQLYLKKI